MAEQHGGAERTASPPPQMTMGLLDYLTAHSLDEDYAYAALRDPAEPGARGRTRGVAGTLVALTLFGILATVAGVETARNADETASSRESLVTQINEREDELAQRRAEAASLAREVSTLENVRLAASATGRMVQGKVERLSVTTGAAPVQGPGIRVTVDDAPDADTPQERVLDQDLQILVNGLWQVGAEAVAVNGERVTSLTAIRHAGGAITVNFDSLRRPYVVSAIGNRDQMAARLLETAAGQTWLTLQSYGLQFKIDAEDSMKLPAEKDLELRYAHTPETLR